MKSLCFWRAHAGKSCTYCSQNTPSAKKSNDSVEQKNIAVLTSPVVCCSHNFSSPHIFCDKIEKHLKQQDEEDERDKVCLVKMQW